MSDPKLQVGQMYHLYECQHHPKTMTERARPLVFELIEAHLQFIGRDWYIQRMTCGCMRPAARHEYMFPGERLT